MGIVIMGPVGGGRLGAPTPAIRDLLPPGAASSAEIALRFVLSNPNVTVALSGMESIQMVEENAATASRGEPLSDAEWAAISAALAEKQKLADLYCTGCGYCMPCPNGVNIPANFALMNTYRVYGLLDHARWEYREEDLAKSKAQASYCQECGECEPKCPQKIPIIEQLKETHGALAR